MLNCDIYVECYGTLFMDECVMILGMNSSVNIVP